METAVAGINAALLGVLIMILIRTYEIGHKIGVIDTTVAQLMKEMETLRPNVHKLSNSVAGLLAVADVRGERERRRLNEDS